MLAPSRPTRMPLACMILVALELMISKTISPMHGISVRNPSSTPTPVGRFAVAEKLEYPMYTARSTAGPAAFLKELATVREQGWATDLGGHEEYINCVAAPIRGADGRVVAAMSVSAPNVVVTADELLTLLPLVRRTADAISGEYSGRTPVATPTTTPDRDTE